MAPCQFLDIIEAKKNFGCVCTLQVLNKRPLEANPETLEKKIA